MLSAGSLVTLVTCVFSTTVGTLAVEVRELVAGIGLVARGVDVVVLVARGVVAGLVWMTVPRGVVTAAPESEPEDLG